MKKVFTDQMGCAVTIGYPPKRIVSLVPSQTELLYDLGLSDEVVGQTLFCIHPQEMHEAKPRVGGTKKLNFSKIAALKPDLIIGNKEENEREQVEELMKHYPVWMSDIHNLEQSLDMIGRIGELTGREKNAGRLIEEISNGFAQLKPRTTVRAAYLIWRDPWMAAGHDTFISDMLGRCGLVNVFEHEASRYPAVTSEKLGSSGAEMILLSSEPYPFKEKHIEEVSALCPGAVVKVVDGELFSWYGSRLRHAPAYLRKEILNGADQDPGRRQ